MFLVAIQFKDIFFKWYYPRRHTFDTYYFTSVCLNFVYRAKEHKYKLYTHLYILIWLLVVLL